MADATPSLSLLQHHYQTAQSRLRQLEAVVDASERSHVAAMQILRDGAYVAEALCRHSLDSALALFREFLHERYAATDSCYFVFTDVTLLDMPAINFLRFHSRNHSVKRSFLALFEHNLPLCDSLQQGHLHLLLGENGDKTQSTLLVPNTDAAWDGLLLLASTTPNSYQHGLPLTYLWSLTAILRHRLQESIR